MKRFNRFVALIVVLSLLISLIPLDGFADVSFTQDVTLEQDLTFSSTSTTALTSADIPIPSGYRNVSILSSSVDNGNITSTPINGNYITVNLNNGTRTNTSTTKEITASTTLPITSQIPDSNNIIKISNLPKNITAISAVNSSDGGLLNATGVGTTSLNVAVDSNKGVAGYDLNNTTTKTSVISVPTTNREKIIQSDTLEVLPFKTASITFNNGNTCTLYAHNDSVSNPQKGLISVAFTNGTPTKTIKVIKEWSCPKRWVDRHLNLWTETKDPNGSGYITVKVNPNQLPGFTASTFDEPSFYEKPTYAGGVDFWGYYLGSKPNINADLDISAKNLFLYGINNYKVFTANDLKNFSANEHSTITAAFTMSSTGINTIRHLKFITPKESWAAYPNESQDKFYDPLYRDYVTKVYHWYYWTGPSAWGTFGGIYTYPYEATVTYQQYNPVKRYTGSVTYQYTDTQVIPSGMYNYSGKVRIRYTTTITGIDKSPGTPAGVIATSSSIMHGVSGDDYTAPEQMRYKYYYYKNGLWNYLGMNTNGVRTYTWNPTSLGLDLLNLKVGVIGVDSRDQESPRGENDPFATINLTGSLDKSTVSPGDTLILSAETDSNPDAYEVNYDIEGKYGSGLMTKSGKKAYNTLVSVVTGKYEFDYNTYKFVSDANFSKNTMIDQTGTTNIFTDVNFTTSKDGSNFVFGSKGTIIIPDINNYGYYGKSFSNYVTPGTFISPDYYYYLGMNYASSIYQMSPDYYPSTTNIFGFMAYYNYTNDYVSYKNNYTNCYATRASYGTPPIWNLNYSIGFTAYAQIWDQKVYLPYWNKPVSITFDGNIYSVYQNGSFIGQVTANRTMAGFSPAYTSHFRTRLYDEGAKTSTYAYLSIGASTGKHLFSDHIWSLDQINNYINNAYPDNFHIADPSKFRTLTTDYGGVKGDGDYHPSNLLDYIPGKLQWQKTITIPSDITGGVHNITLTAKNGLSKSITLSFFLNVPEVLTPKGIMPQTAVQGKTYAVTATSTQQASQMDLKVFGSTYTMAYNGITYADKDYTVGNNLYPQPASNTDFTVRGNGIVNPVVGQPGTYSYDYSQNLLWTWHGFDVPADTSKYYTYSFDAMISTTANIPSTGTTFIANGEMGFGTSFSYDNTKKGTWQHFELTARPTTTTARLLLYPSTNVTPATMGNIQYKNLQFKVHPGAKKWTYSLTIPSNALTGDYNTLAAPFKKAEFKATSSTGRTESDFQPFSVATAPGVSGGNITAQPGETVQIVATTTGYCTSSNVVMPTGTVNLVSDNPASYYNNTWRGSYTVPITQPLGNYNITYNATNAFATDSKGATLNVVLTLAPIGDIPDSMETKTPWKAKCTTTISASSVTVAINPSPGASPYTMHLVSNDGAHKYWETNNLTYPEMSAGGADGKTVTGTFTVKAPNGYTESATDTGHLWEKIELTSFELRRLLYQNNDSSLPIVETLSRTPSTEMADSAGLICAGWDMGVKIMTSGFVDKIEYDFEGPTVNYEQDNSIKTLDNLTKRFEWDEVVKRGRTPGFTSLSDLQNSYVFPKNFSRNAAPITDFHNIYTTYYTIPYGAKQSLHSWYTLRQESGSAFNINKSKLLNRIKVPFVLKLTLYSKSRFVEKEVKLDVFERWDTLLNRDIRPYITNSGNHDPVSKNLWENTDYVE